MTAAGMRTSGDAERPWLTTSPAATRAAPPAMPRPMIVVRRYVLKRFPHQMIPAKKTTPARMNAPLMITGSRRP